MKHKSNSQLDGNSFDRDITSSEDETDDDDEDDDNDNDDGDGNSCLW